MNIQPYLNEINLLNPNQQVIQYRVENWLNYDFGHELINNHVVDICNNYPNGVSRQNIIQYFEMEESDIVKGFILVMIWGRGMDNRGPWYVRQIFNDINNSITSINNSARFILNCNLIEAHNELSELNRCKVNFFSKFMYFLGKSRGINNYPLIFDARVTYNITRLNSVNPELINLISLGPNQSAEAYLNYVNIIHELANNYGIDADKIELFLFNGNF